MHRFDYSFLKSVIPGNIVGLSDVISDLRSKEEFRKIQYTDAFETLRQKAVIESVKGSNAIEGIVTTDERIQDIVDGASPATHDEMEISGYKDALNLIHTEYKNMDIDEKTILRFHQMIVGQVRFKPVSATSTPKAMQQLVLAYYDARQDSEIPKLLLIPCFILDFLCIHPFSDGNGRISRLLTVLLLYLSGYDIVRYISFEGLVNTYKDSYYNTLKQSSDLWHENKNDYVPFMVNFMQLLYKSYKTLDESFTEISLKKAKKSERVECILANAIVPISKKEILEKVPDISVKTVELVLSKMLKNNSIKKIGTYKDARYIKK